MRPQAEAPAELPEIAGDERLVDADGKPIELPYTKIEEDGTEVPITREEFEEWSRQLGEDTRPVPKPRGRAKGDRR